MIYDTSTILISAGLGALLMYILLKIFKRKPTYNLRAMRELVYNTGKNLIESYHNIKKLEKVLKDIEGELR